MKSNHKLLIALGIVLLAIAILLVLKNAGVIFPHGIVEYHE